MPDNELSETERLEPHHEEPSEPRPMGAVVITTLLLITIVVMWFGMYLLNLVRS